MERVTQTRTSIGVLVLHKTLDILEVIRDAPEGLTLAELARLASLPKATVYRILNTLEGRGYLDRTGVGRYRVTNKLLDMQRSLPIEQIIIRGAQPHVIALVAECTETVNLGVLEAGEVAVIHTLESPLAVRMSSKIGNRRFLHSTALGKVLLSGLPDREVLRLLRLKGQPRMTPNTIVTTPALLAELKKVREQGYAVDDQEHELEGRCLGAPIVDFHGNVLAALSISSPVFRMDPARVARLAVTLRQTCAAISRSIHI